ncbi:MAG: HAD-IIIC family phosphatase [Thermoguttaceae bacterium]
MKQQAAENELVDRLLADAPAAELAAAAQAILRQQQALSVGVGEAIARQLVSRLGDAATLADAMRMLEKHDTAMSRFVRARVLAYRGESARAIDAFQSALRAASVPDADVLLHRARLLARENRFPEAIADLRLALQLFPAYHFFVKCEKLLDRIVASGQWQPRRTAKLAILASSTTALLAPVLRAAGFRRGLKLDVYEGVYGNYRQEILDPQSGFYQFRPDLTVILLNHRDLGLPPAGGERDAREFVARLRELWTILLERNPCHLVQVGFDSPPAGAWGSLEDTLPEGRRRVVASANLAMAADLPQGVSFVDANALSAEVGPGYWSAAEWHAAKQYPSSAALPRLADALCAHCAAALGLSAKVLVVDLDNTLWGGVIGEDLLEGIRIGPSSAEGEGYRELQQYLKELQQRGVLLAVCSKNNPADAELPFRRHDDMLLTLDDFAAFVANWDDKPTNLERIAENLSLGLDSFVFLDDNPMERALIRARLPQVIVPECGETPWEMLAALHRGQYFEAVTLTDEDRLRHAAYAGNAARADAQQNAASLESFFSGLEMAARQGPVDAQTLPRVAQLINKTNQFNLTTRRYTEDQVAAMAASPEWWCRWFRLADRFGDHGLIGVLLARKGTPAWRVDTWLMSCRVLGRQMEDFMCASLLSAAQREGARAVIGQYVPSEKNAVVSDLYPRLRFKASSADGREYVFSLTDRPIPACQFIRDESTGEKKA